MTRPLTEKEQWAAKLVDGFINHKMEGIDILDAMSMYLMHKNNISPNNASNIASDIIFHFANQLGITIYDKINDEKNMIFVYDIFLSTLLGNFIENLPKIMEKMKEEVQKIKDKK